MQFHSQSPTNRLPLDHQRSSLCAPVSAIKRLGRWVSGMVCGAILAGSAQAAFDISLTADGSPIVDVGQFRGVNVAYSWSSLTQNLSNGQIVIDLPATLDANDTSDVQVYGSAHTTSAVYTPATRKVTFTFVNPLPAGSSGTVQFFVRFPTNAADGTLALINGTSSGTGQPNGTGSVTLEANAVPLATDLRISKSANIYPMLGQEVTYTIAVANYGTTDYLNPVVVDQLPAGTVYVSSNPVGAYNGGSNTVQWTNSTLTPGNTHYYNVTVRYDGPTFSVGQWVNNVATATGTDSLSAPVNLTTNTSVQIVAPNPAAGIDKWDSADPASLRGNFQYYFWVTNQGNVPLTNYTFTDDLPKEFIPAYIYPGSDDNGNFTSTINVWYKTTANAAWQLLPGSPFITDPGDDPGVAVNTLGLAPGEIISSLKYEFASVPVGYDADWRPRVVGTMGDPVTGLDRLGAVITPLPKTISNTYDVTYVHSGTTYTGSDTETTEIMGASPMPTFSIYDAVPSSYIPLQEIKWTLRMENDWGGSEPLITPVYGTLLPASLEYVPGSVLVTEGPLSAPAVTVTNNYNGTGRQLVKFSFAGNHPVAWTEISGMWDDWAVYMDFKTRVKAGAAAGSAEVEYHLLSTGNLLVNGDLAETTRTDTNDLDGDANTTEKFLTSNGGDFSVSTSTAIDSVLWVKGQLDADFNRYPDAGFSLPSGTMQYKLIVSNPGNIPLTGIRILDILPHVGDVGVVLHSQSRGSDFGLTLTSTVTAPPGVTVNYSTATNPVRTDLDATLSSPSGAASGSFSATPPAPLSNTKSLLFDFGATVLNPGESKEILWTMSLPAVITSGQVAWNSIGQRSQSATTGSPLPPSEPIKVGIAAPLTVGSQVWNDLDNDGAYDAGEPGIPGVTLQIFKSNGSAALDPLGNLVPSVTTNASGVYAFTALADGDYVVRVTPPVGYIPSGVQTADPNNDSDTDSNIDLARSPPSGSYESGVFTFATNTEPTVEPSPGGTQDDVDDNNGNMTVDFGFRACTTMTLPAIAGTTVGTAYSASVAATGGTAPHSYAVTVGALPAWATLNAGTGAITGTSNSTTSASFTITVTDANGCLGSRAYTITPTCPTLTMSPAAGALAQGTVGTPYSQSFSSTGSTGTLTWSVSSGTLPAGLTISSATGVISGTPTAATVGMSGSSISIKAEDQYGCSITRAYTLKICPVLVFPASMPSPVIGVNYALLPGTIASASGGTAPYVYSLSGAPAWMSINSSTAQLSGTPLSTGSVSFTVNAVDAYGCTGSKAYTVSMLSLSIGNIVWNDTNNNGTKDVGELGLGGATVQLFTPGTDNAIGGIGGAADTQIGSDIVTGPTGSYVFSALSPGKYFVKVTPPAGYITSGTPDTADNGDDNDNNGAQPGGLGNPVFSPIIDLAIGLESIADGDVDANTNYTVDFGLWSGIQLGNLVWMDSNDNGTKDAAENGISGLTVELLTGVGNTVITSTTTNGTGQYGFTVYTAGNYRVRVTPNTTYPLASTTHATTDNGVDNNNDGDQPGNKSAPATSPVFTLTAGGEPGSSGSSNTENTIDFGFRGCPTISSTPTTLVTGNVGAPYSATVTASGGVAPYTYAITTGSLPAGLTLAPATGVISGTTSVSGSFALTITATDSLGCTGATAITLPISATPTYDYGDYSPFPLASNFGSTTLRLGTLVDADASSPANGSASGDDASNTDDEDGIVEPINLVPSVAGSTVVKVTNTTGATAYLNAWIDFNRNGIPNEAGEQVMVNAPITTGTTNANQTISFTTPAGAFIGFTAIRVRLTSTLSPSASGAVGMGEVEDYPVNICPTLGFAYGTQSGDLYQIDVATGVVSPAASLPSGFERSNGAAFAQDLGQDGVVLYTTGTASLLLGAWDRYTGTTNVVGDFSAFGVAGGSKIYSGDYFNGWYYFVVNNTDDLWKAKITGTSGNYTLTAASKVSDMWSNTRSHGYGDIVVTPGGILYAHANNDAGGTDFFTCDLNQATPTATLLGNPPYMHNGITFGLDGKLYGGLGVSASNADWFEVSLANGASTYIRDGAVSGMSDMTMGACSPSQFLIDNDPYANKDFGDFSFVTSASSTVNTNIRLGALVDSESTIANNATASSDDTLGVDDEDGVTFSQLVQGQTATVTIARTNSSGAAAYLSAWIDFDNDGLLSGVGETVINNVLIPSGTNGALAYTFTIPATAYVGNVGARFRITNTSNPGPTGLSGSGEIEDHLANIEPSLSIGNLVWNDLNNNGIKDATETGFSGATVQLFRAGADNLANTGDDVQVGGSLITDGTGAYSFSILAPAKYFVKVTPTAGYIPGGTPATTDNNVDNNNDGTQPGAIGTALFSPVIDLTVNAESITDGDTDPNTNFTVDFGLFPGMLLGNQVWYDANDNGVKDGAEIGINGLLVELLNGTTNAVITSTTTNASGQYGFTVYSAGSYKVRVTPAPSLPLSSTSFVVADNGVDNDNNGNQPGLKNSYSTSSAFTLTPMGEPGPAGSSNTEHTIDFGFRPCPTVTVTTTPSPLDIAVMRRPYSQVANATGGWGPYTFSIAAGALPGGLTISAGGVISGTPTADGIFNATILATDAKGCTGQTSVVIEVLPPLSIGNMVFLDNNGNGRADAGEGLNGVTMQLYTSVQTPGVSTPIATTVTAGGGLYIFEGLLPGIYRVHVPAAMFTTGAPLYSTISVAEGLSGDDDVGENGLNSNTPDTTGISSGLITVAVGQAPTDINGETGLDHASDNTYDAAIDLTVDFGFANPMGVGNLVFIDANTNGHYDAGEGVEGVTVELYRSTDTPGSSSPVTSQLTNANGHYLFDYLLTGSYFVYIPSTEFNTGGPLEGKISVSGSAAAAVDDSVDENGIDNLAPVINGIRSTTFTLANNTAPTNATGETGYLASEDVRDDNNYDLTIDLGFRAPDPNAVGVGNAVFLDANGNRFFDTGEGVDGVVVRLYAAAANPATTAPLATTVTANGGSYAFTGLPAGDYFIQIPSSMFAGGAALANALSLPNQGGDNGMDDDQDENGSDTPSAVSAGVRSTDFELAPNSEPTNTNGEFGSNAFADDTDDNNTDLTIDFGFYRPVGVGNLVFVDASRNGHFNPGEGKDGVTVELYTDAQSPGFDTPQATTVTAGGGFYQFGNLVPGYYIVHIPTSNFAPGGILEAFSPLVGQGADDGTDDDLDENGSDPTLAFAEGVSSLPVALTSGGEPTDQTTERGSGASSDNATDSDYDFTVDFGFVATSAGSFAQWQASNALGGQNGPTDDPDGDGMSNAAEYTFGLSPSTGVLPHVPFEIKLNTTTNKVDAFVRKLSPLDDVVVTLQGINDLASSPGGWTDITTIAPEVIGTVNGLETIAFRDLEQLTTLFTGGKGFVRLHLVLDTNHDNTPEATANTDAWGWSRRTLAAQIITYSNPFLKSAVFTGAVTSVTGASLDVAAAVGSDAIAGAMTGTIPWYIEVVSGDNEGHRFEVNELGSTATTILLETSNALNTLTTIPASLAGDRIALRPHFTLAEWLPPSKFRATNSSGTADRLMFYTGTTFATTWLFNNGGNPKWVNDASLTDRGTRVMDPAEAFLIQPKSTSAPAFVNLGVVRAHKFACPLKQGTRLIAGGYPMDQSPTSRGMLATNGFTSSSSSTRSDRIQIWNGDATPGATTYENHYLLNAVIFKRWVKVGDSSLTSEDNLPLFKSMRGVYFNSYVGKPDYVAPRPWTP